jgi:hypothetical protein
MASFYSARVEAPERAIDRLKERLKGALEAVAVEKLKTPTCTVWLQESSSVDVDPKTVIQHYGIDHEFTDIAVSVVKTTIRHALERGEVVEGAKLVTTKHLRVR